MTGRWAGLLGWACLCLSCAAHAEVRSELEYQAYQVVAIRGKSLYQVLEAVSPIRENGHAYLGHTSRDTRWSLHWHDSGGTCRLDSIHVSLHVTITLPQLEGVDPDRQAEYSRFYSALRIHEDGHYRNALKMADDIERALEALPAMGNCRELEEAANAAGHRVIADTDRQDRDYDARTGHGRTQGAYLKN